MSIRFPLRFTIGLTTLAMISGGLLFSHPASGQSTPLDGTYDNRASLNDSSGTNAQGLLSVNIASGNNNQQLQAVVIVEGNSSLATPSIRQRLDKASGGGGASAAYLGANAFNGAKGLIGINVSAGNDNQEANLALIGIGTNGSAATDALLSQTRASTENSQPENGVSPKTDSAKVEPSAFGNSQGLLQVNLIAGERNSSANVFALTMSAGG